MWLPPRLSGPGRRGFLQCLVSGVPMSGRGYQVGRLRPDFGDRFADLECDNDECGASWVGEIGEECAYCHDDAPARRWAASRVLHEFDQRVQAERGRGVAA